MYISMFTLLAVAYYANVDNGTRSAADFSFPSSIASSRSPVRHLVASYQDHGGNASHVHEYQFLITDASRRTLASFFFSRSIEGTWSSDGRDIFINNYIGSNLNDCLISDTSRGRFSLVGLTRLLMQRGISRGRTASHISENPDNSHFSLTCSRWLTNGGIEVSVQGYVDTVASFGREFSYRLRFSPETGTFRRL